MSDLDPLLARLADLVAERLADPVAERVAARLAAGHAPTGNGNGRAAPAEPDRLLTAAEAAARLGVRPRWVYDHADELKMVRLPGRMVRFSERALARCVARREGR